MKVVELSGGVGGARMARGLAALPEVDLTVVVNVGDDASNHGLHVAPDIDTVIYTLASIEGPQGWGRADDTFHLNTELARFGVDNTFQLGDRDLALKLFRTRQMANGVPLSVVTEDTVRAFDVGPRVLPSTDQELRTEIRTDTGWLSFQEYFVDRGHRDNVRELRFAGSSEAEAAPGVLEAIAAADSVIIGPSNPPLSIWPILSVAEIRSAVEEHPSVTAVSPLVEGKALKGPADRVMQSLGLPGANLGVATAYSGLIDRLVVHETDGDEAARIPDVEVVVTDILIKEPEAAARLAAELVPS